MVTIRDFIECDRTLAKHCECGYMSPYLDSFADWMEAYQFAKALGRQFKQTVESATSSIADHPLRYRTIRSPFKRYLLQKFPFSIIYTIEPDHIYIVAIAHNRRKPEYWSDRPKSHSE